MRQALSASHTPFRKVLWATVLVLILVPAASQAQMANVWLPKFVCGYQTGNVPLLNNPNPPIDLESYEEFKPGNYATTVNVFNADLASRTVLVYAQVTTESPSPSVPVMTQVLSGLFETPGIGSNLRVGCPAIVGALLASGIAVPMPGGLIEGHLVILEANGEPNLQVDTVNTFESQNAFERQILWGQQIGNTNTTTISRNHHTTLSPIRSPLPPQNWLNLQMIAASGSGGMGLGASIDVERWDPVEVDIAILDLLETVPGDS